MSIMWVSLQLVHRRFPKTLWMNMCRSAILSYYWYWMWMALHHIGWSPSCHSALHNFVSSLLESRGARSRPSALWVNTCERGSFQPCKNTGLQQKYHCTLCHQSTSWDNVMAMWWWWRWWWQFTAPPIFIALTPPPPPPLKLNLIEVSCHLLITEKVTWQPIKPQTLNLM